MDVGGARAVHIAEVRRSVSGCCARSGPFVLGELFLKPVA